MEPRELLRALMAKGQDNPNSLAAKLNHRTKQPQIYKFLEGIAKEPKRSTLQPIADHYGIPVAAFYDPEITAQIAETLKPSSPSNVIAVHQEDPLPEGFIYIKESAIAFSGGNGRTPHIELIEESDPVAYSSTWFQKRRINPENVRRYKVVDHSMEPFLFDGDTVLVNHAETTVKDGKIYAFRYGDDLRIKQLFCRLDGTLILHSINTAFKDEEVSQELANEHIAIIGRVREKSGSGGL